MNVKRTLVYGAIAASLALATVFSQTLSVSAQGGPNGPQIRMFGLSNPCSTTDYTAVAATALGITAPELRLALVSGKTLQDLAADKNVTLDDVNKALDAARQADLEQAQKDGTVPTLPSLPTLPGQGGSTPSDKMRPGSGIAIRAFGRGVNISQYNEINPLTVAAQAIGVSCPDLVKAASGGKSIVQVATEKNVQVQTVIDAIVKARKDALAQDVKEGLITQAQADGRSVRLVEQVTQMISMPGAFAMWFDGFNGFGNFQFEFRDNGNNGWQSDSGRPNRPGRNDKSPNAPDTTPAAPDATPEATPNA
ncbi:MAG: hypothetical protein KF716_21175 [Anaerolineae bacterium]|nr:hypothetical protein [Anaerolineae bacterium]